MSESHHRSVVVVFPGQGSQYVGMGREACSAFAEARATFDEADDVLGFSLSSLCFEGDEDELRRTENTQPALLTISIALQRALAARGFGVERWSALAGHSLGQYSALVAAGSLEFAAALELVRARGRYMQESVPEGEGAMAAILGLENDVVRAVCMSATAAVSEASGGSGSSAQGIVEPANYNAPGQVVVAGHRAAVEAAVVAAKERGARRAILLNVSAPFHCSLMEPAAERLIADLAAVDISPPRVPVVCNVTAQPLADAATVRRNLGEQVTSPVRWAESVRRMASDATKAVDDTVTFAEIGPGRVLAGLVKRTLKDAAGGTSIHSVETPEQVETLLAET